MTEDRALPYGATRSQTDMTFRLVADHLRTALVAFADNACKAMTSGPGLVYRMLIRSAEWRAHAYLKMPRHSLHHLIPVVADTLEPAIPKGQAPVDKMLFEEQL